MSYQLDSLNVMDQATYNTISHSAGADATVPEILYRFTLTFVQRSVINCSHDLVSVSTSQSIPETQEGDLPSKS